ncbi:hypothetical protein like AT5G52740 [Hibiscus trionum]|uniref:HMA domain-containing protein n=1 Tax=Hibiscus trionum TaxID=183268 RepID=A0A9W7J121_HIBTR|nr:hypothetical protein like AT5G52740 [Hibiscus trionum]
MKKVVLKLDFHDEKCRQKVMKTASGISGVESVALDKDQKLTVTGDIDPVVAVRKLRKLCQTNIISVGPAKEPEKKKEEPKKDEKKGDANKCPPPYPVYYPPPIYCHPPVYMEEDPASCVIC